MLVATILGSTHRDPVDQYTMLQTVSVYFLPAAMNLPPTTVRLLLHTLSDYSIAEEQSHGLCRAEWKQEPLTLQSASQAPVVPCVRRCDSLRNPAFDGLTSSGVMAWSHTLKITFLQVPCEPRLTMAALRLTAKRNEFEYLKYRPGRIVSV